jgi:hypothetical protein
MTFAIVRTEVTCDTPIGSRELLAERKAIAVDIRCEGNLFIKLIRAFQTDPKNNVVQLFLQKVALGENISLQGVSFVTPQVMADYLRINYSGFSVGSQNCFLICDGDQVRLVSATATKDGFLIEEIDPDSPVSTNVTLYLMQPVTK